MQHMEKLKVLYVTSGNRPYEKTIENDLKSMQALVGGYIELIRIDDNSVIVCNEDARLVNMPLNRILFRRKFGEPIDILGNFFICQHKMNDKDLYSLTDSQIKEYSQKFEYPIVEINA